MDVSLSHAANAYASRMQQEMGGADDDAETGGAANANGSFATMLGQALDSVVATGNKAEHLEMQAVSGDKVDLSDLVTAVANAELSLNTVVAIRDRVISAYQSILGMPI